ERERRVFQKARRRGLLREAFKLRGRRVVLGLVTLERLLLIADAVLLLKALGLGVLARGELLLALCERARRRLRGDGVRHAVGQVPLRYKIAPGVLVRRDQLLDGCEFGF